ncbi:putative glucooligosaccharide oxidase [Xylariomycetidae sp. FL2044]|nr:putative glucooligosaccharide oxidase [Xylariomycetidae sp. FL2044]
MHLTSSVCLGLLATLVQGAVLDKRAALADCLATSSTALDVEGSDDWNRDVAPYNERMKFTPAAIAVPMSVEQIQATVTCGRELGYKVTPKGGGHSYASLGLGGEDGHLVIELDRLHTIKLNNETGTVWTESGARLGHLAAELYAQGNRAISHGTCPGVGLSGHILHGGFGMSSHSRGLAMDWVEGLTMVLANSSVVHASATENPDLFWAMLGAGSNFGVVTSYDLKTFEPPANLTWFIANLPWKKNNSVAALEVLEDYVLNTMPAELNMRVFGTKASTQLEGVYQGDRAGLEAALQPLFDKAGGNILQAKTTDWIGQLEHYATTALNQTTPYTQQSETFYGKSLELKGLSGKAAENFVNYWQDIAKSQSLFWYFQMDLQGGKNSAVWNADPNLTSYAHRDKLYILQFYIRANSVDLPAEAFPFIDDWASTTTAPLAADDYGMYFNYPDTSLNSTMAQQMYWGKNLPKLQQMKAELDPEGLFYYPGSITPAVPA